MGPGCRAGLWNGVGSDTETGVLSGDDKLWWLTPVVGIGMGLSLNKIFFSF